MSQGSKSDLLCGQLLLPLQFSAPKKEHTKNATLNKEILQNATHTFCLVQRASCVDQLNQPNNEAGSSLHHFTLQSEKRHPSQSALHPDSKPHQSVTLKHIRFSSKTPNTTLLTTPFLNPNAIVFHCQSCVQAKLSRQTQNRKVRKISAKKKKVFLLR